VEGWLEVDVERDDSPDCGDCWPHEVQPAGVRENETDGERKRNGERIDHSFRIFPGKAILNQHFISMTLSIMVPYPGYHGSISY
jgi:hypothetical protein